MKASAIILAGGNSSRMNYNKAFARIGEEFVIKIIIKKCQGVFPETIIISNDTEIYQDMGVRLYADVFPRMGPIAGIHSGLTHAAYDTVFIMACDMPFMNMELAKYMIIHAENYDCVVPVVNGCLQPLTAVYNKSCIPVLTDCLEQDKLKLTMLFREFNTRYINEDELAQFGDVDTMFLNVNDPAALQKARVIAGRSYR